MNLQKWRVQLKSYFNETFLLSILFLLATIIFPQDLKAYPITNISEAAKLTASDAAASDYFGISVSVSGDTAVAGAHRTTNGTVYIYERNEGGADAWGEVKTLTASDAAADDYFGYSVSISGDTIVVGASFDDDAGSASGAAYIFERNEGGANAWGQVKKVTASDAASLDKFGTIVSISGDTVVVGAPYDDDGGTDSGSVYIFERNEGGANAWGQVKKLTASDAAASDAFGESLSVSGDTLVIGAHLDDDFGSTSGSAYIFERNEGGANVWGQVKKLSASDAAELDHFAESISVDGDVIVAGAAYDDDVASSSGSAYIFERNEGGANAWGQVKKLTALDAIANDLFGNSVSISGDTVVVGANYSDGGGSNSGAAYIFQRNEGGSNVWGEVDKLITSDAAAGDYFGYSVSTEGDTVIAGAWYGDAAGVDSGSAYIYKVEYSNAAPVITSDGGEVTAAVNAAENQTYVTTVAANDANGDPVRFYFTGGADQTAFGIHSSTGVLSFNSASDFEIPGDADANNLYVVEVTASDGIDTDLQVISVTVTDVAEVSDITPPVTIALPSGGTYTSAQSVTLTADEAATIYYTTDGSTPTTSSTVYSGAIDISSTTTLKFFAMDLAGNVEGVNTEDYILNLHPLDRWTNVTSIPSFQQYDRLISVIYGQDRFVATGSRGIIWTSPDGEAWRNITTNSGWDLKNVAYGNGMYIAVASGYHILTSPDGEIWTERSTGTSNHLYGIAYGNGVFVAVGGTDPNGEAQILSSPDGINWTEHIVDIPFTAENPNTFFSVTYADGLFVAVGVGGRIITSPDGINWTVRTSGETLEFMDVGNGNGKFIALASIGGPDTHTNIYISSDGINWSRTYTHSGDILNDVHYADGTYIAVGTSRSILESPDGINWEQRNSGEGGIQHFNGVASHNGYYVIVGTNCTIMKSDFVPDVTAPTGMVTVNDGSLYSNSSAVTLSFEATDDRDGLLEMQFSNNSTTGWSGWQSYSTTASWTLESGDGVKTVYIRFKDSAGNVSELFSDKILLDTTKPTGTVTINSSASTTIFTDVTLTLTCDDGLGSGCAWMKFSNAQAHGWSAPEPFNSTKSWILAGGAGANTVYVWLGDSAGNGITSIFEAASDTITLLTSIAPDNPTNLSGTSNDDGSIAVSWSAPEASDVRGYNIYRDDVKINTTLITSTNHTDYTTTDAITYNYRVASVDLTGKESSGVAVSVTSLANVDLAPSVPEGVMLENTGAGESLNVAWLSNPEKDIAGYKVYWGTVSGDYISSFDVGNLTAFTITGLSEGTTYYIAVSAYDADLNESGKSIERTKSPKLVSDRPSQPSDLIVTEGNEYLKLEWSPTPSVSGYMVYIGDADGLYSVPVRTSDTTYTFEKLQNTRTYYVAVASYDIEGASRYSVSSISDKVTSSASPFDGDAPAPPNISAEDVGTGDSVLLVWDRAESFDIAGYVVAYKKDEALVFEDIRSVDVNWNYVVTGLTQDAGYSFYVYSYDKSGNFSEPGLAAATPSDSGLPLDLISLEPPLLGVLPGNGKVDLTITPTSDGDVDHYNLYIYNLSAGKYMPLASTPALSYEHSQGVENGTPLVFVATAVDAGGNESGYSDPANVIPNELLGDIELEKDPPVLDRVDGYDIMEIAKGFGKNIGHPDFNPNADLNGDGILDGEDVTVLAPNHGKRKGE